MKILKLRFKNLNSLAGEWEIDFSSPQYTSEGIFAITGPTGAGKSTILDAICLGLYGKTPRLKNITAAENEIMSRKTGACYAEVFFESQKGIFRSNWSQRRSRDKATGALQSPKFEISDETTNKIIESQLSKTPKVIEELTGMDFNRFTQAMMLAQGSFAAFLQASENDRAAMLEDITGTEIYSELSKLAFERNKAEKDTLHEMQLQAGVIKILSEDELMAFETESNENQLFIQQKNKDKKAVDDSLQWLKQIADFAAELQRLETAKTTNEASIIEFAPQQTRLNMALKAAELEADFVQLQADRKAVAANIQESKTISENLPQLETDCINANNQFKNKQEEQQSVAKNAEAERETFKQVRAMDVLIAEKRKTATELFNNKNIVEKQRNELDKKIADLSDLIQKSSTELQTSSNYLTQHKADEALQEEAPALKAKIATLVQNIKTLSEKNSEIAKSKNDKLLVEKVVATKGQAINEMDSQNQKLTAEIDKVSKASTELLAGRTTDDYRRELNLLNENLRLQQKIESYEMERTHLQDGKSCPLCGSEHHPFALGNIPPSNATKERIETITKLMSAIEKTDIEKRNAENAYQRKQIELTNAKAELKIKQSEIENFEANLKQKSTEYNLLNETTNNLGFEIKNALANFGITEGNNWLQVSELISNRTANWKHHNDSKTAIEAEILRIEGERNTHVALRDEAQNQLKKLNDDFDTQKENFDNLTAKRTELFGTKNTDTEEQTLGKKITQAAEAIVVAQNAFAQAENLLKNKKQRLEELKSALIELEPNLKQLEKQFELKREEAEFTTESDFVMARLPIDERNNLRQQAEMLSNIATGIKAKLEELKIKLETEEAKNLTQESTEELQKQAATFAEEINSLISRNGAITNTLNTDKSNREQYSELLNTMELQKAEQQKWAHLDNSIGSADGKKFRRFAQGLTFEIMVRAANQQLAKLSDRYELMRTIDSPLSLSVIDNYQAGEQRSTKNLSGGESFLVSLSLALGLSHIASKNVRIDSLFLDEGFGTLDEETLEIALNTLASIQQDGKLIGVISHISQMKDRINTKIVVEKNSNGRSTLSGPGCRRME